MKAAHHQLIWLLYALRIQASLDPDSPEPFDFLVQSTKPPVIENA
jgi:hypothetical protein